jgi:sporulation protein YlmC with PRC-barrel domain
MKRQILMASAVSALLALSVGPVLADSSTTTSASDADVNTNMGVTAIDAGKLIDKDVYDAKGDKVGSIESVIVDTSGKVTSVVLNVGGWLSTDKRIFVAWKDLQSSPDGKITSTLTKDQAQAAADYKYKKDQDRGKVTTTAGAVYNSDATTAAGAPTTAQPTANGNTSQSASLTMGTPVRNADGSLNASQVIGTKVVNDQDESIGKIGEIVLGSNGKPSGVVVDVGGFLGIGTHPVLLGWKQISLVDNDGSTQAVVKASKDELKQMPAYSAK